MTFADELRQQDDRFEAIVGNSDGAPMIDAPRPHRQKGRSSCLLFDEQRFPLGG